MAGGLDQGCSRPAAMSCSLVGNSSPTATGPVGRFVGVGYRLVGRLDGSVGAAGGYAGTMEAANLDGAVSSVSRAIARALSIIPRSLGAVVQAKYLMLVPISHWNHVEMRLDAAKRVSKMSALGRGDAIDEADSPWVYRYLAGLK